MFLKVMINLNIYCYSGLSLIDLTILPSMSMCVLLIQTWTCVINGLKLVSAVPINGVLNIVFWGKVGAITTII